MSKVRYKDFDKFFEQQGKEKVILRLLGKEWILPSSLPAPLMLKIIRNRNVEEANPELIFDMLKDLFGQKQYNQLMELGISIDQINAVIEWVMDIYNGTEGVTEKTESDDSDAPSK